MKIGYQIVKKSHIEYEMALTSIYKQAVVLTLQTSFVRMSYTYMGYGNVVWVELWVL
jgi:hypothetical protein